MDSKKCPEATINLQLNLLNRRKAIRTASYGPANPGLPNVQFWKQIARIWGVSSQEAQTMRCGNCAAFDVTSHVLECIENGIGRDGIDPDDTIVAAHLGYCRFFKFKCAASRTCSAWVTGGPITDDKLVAIKKKPKVSG